MATMNAKATRPHPPDDDPRVVATLVRFGVAEFERLLHGEGSGRVATFQSSHGCGGKRIVNRPLWGFGRQGVGLRLAGGSSSAQPLALCCNLDHGGWMRTL
jgi:hypothetical protein